MNVLADHVTFPYDDGDMVNSNYVSLDIYGLNWTKIFRTLHSRAR